MAKLTAIGVIVFAFALGIGIGLNLSQSTVILLSGCAIGVLCAAAGVAYGAQTHNTQTSEPPVIHHHFYDNRTVVIQSPPDSIGRQHARAMLEDASQPRSVWP